jgi:phage portal protein BeeE
VNLVQSLIRAPERRMATIEDFAAIMASVDLTGGLVQTLAGNREEPPVDFLGRVSSALFRNSAVMACINLRVSTFSEVRLAFREIVDGSPGKLVSGTDARNPGFRDLALLNQPWPTGSLSDLLSRSLLYNDLAGNSYTVREFTSESGSMLRVLRPDWVIRIYGSESESRTIWDTRARLVGILYTPGGLGAGEDPQFFPVEQVAHFTGFPDPLSPTGGRSWLEALNHEVAADNAMSEHKLRYFSNAATPNMVVSLDVQNLDAFNKWVEKMESKHTGVLNAWKTLYLGAGAKVNVVGNNLKDVDFGGAQDAGEARICAAAGVPPVLVGLAESLQGSSLNTGNYSSAKRQYADSTLRPLWRNFVSAHANIITVPAGMELWYDDDVPFLAENQKDRAEIFGLNATAANQLVQGGWEPDAIVEAITAVDFGRLNGTHSGLFSVQLQPPGKVVPAVSAPVPVPALAAGGRSGELRCSGCGKLVAELTTAPYRLTCRHCHTVNEASGLP